MKVIDLLNKIANKEEVPKKIKVLFNVFEYDEYNYNYKNVDETHASLLRYLGFYKGTTLNEEIEIIEDIPKEDISDLKWGKYVIKKDVKKCSQEDLRTYISLLMETQNEIIDYLKSKGK